VIYQQATHSQITILLLIFFLFKLFSSLLLHFPPLLYSLKKDILLLIYTLHIFIHLLYKSFDQTRPKPHLSPPIFLEVTILRVNFMFTLELLRKPNLVYCKFNERVYRQLFRQFCWKQFELREKPSSCLHLLKIKCYLNPQEFLIQISLSKDERCV